MSSPLNLKIGDVVKLNLGLPGSDYRNYFGDNDTLKVSKIDKSDNVRTYALISPKNGRDY